MSNTFLLQTPMPSRGRLLARTASMAAAAAIILLSCAVVGTVAQAAPRYSVAQSLATLLPGGVNDCPTFNSSACVGGLRAVDAYLRDLRSKGHIIQFFPTLDRQTAFVQMHPSKWGANALVASALWNMRTFIVPPSFYITPLLYPELRNANCDFFVSNVDVPADAPWFGYQRRDWISDGIAVVSVDSSAQPTSRPTVSTIVATVRTWQLRPAGEIRARVLLFADGFSIKISDLVAQLDAAETSVDLIWDTENTFPTYVINRTVVVGAPRAANLLSRVELVFGGANGTTVVNATVFTHSLNTVPPALQDATYRASHSTLRLEALKASVNNPIIGYTTFMPVTRVGNYRWCFEGQCGTGSLVADALRWKGDADFAVAPSGGVRGAGWPAGPVNVSNLWEMLPFANTWCTGRLLGLSIVEMFNFSLTMATIPNPALTPTGDRLLQVAGLRVTYNAQLPNQARLIGVEVLNRKTKQFEAVERLKVYTYASDSFVCRDFLPYPTYLAGRYKGEGPQVHRTDLLQDIIGEFLGAMSSPAKPYVLEFAGRLINDTAARASDALRWTMEQSQCPSNTRWEGLVASCVPCEAGKESDPGSAVCTPVPSYLAVFVAVPIAAVLLLIVGGWGVRNEIDKRKNVRNVAHAPKAGNVVLVFTDIQDSTKLWSTCPASMSVALDEHHRVIRECISKHAAYEVKTVGDSFMIASGNIESAIRMVCDIQLRLNETPFPRAITEVYAATTEDELLNVKDDAEDMAPLDELWNGVRVRIGLHVGVPEVQFDQVAKGYDYYGPPVNVAARVESVGKGGQIVMSRAVMDALQPGEYVCTPLGGVDLKGVAEKTEIFQVLPTALLRRTFAPINPEDQNKVDEDLESATGSIASFMPHGSMRSVNGAAPMLSTMPSNVGGVDKYAEQLAFINALIAAGKPPQKKELVALLCKMWRVSQKTTDDARLREVLRRAKPKMPWAGKERRASSAAVVWEDTQSQNNQPIFLGAEDSGDVTSKSGQSKSAHLLGASGLSYNNGPGMSPQGSPETVPIGVVEA